MSQDNAEHRARLIQALGERTSALSEEGSCAAWREEPSTASPNSAAEPFKPCRLSDQSENLMPHLGQVTHRFGALARGNHAASAAVEERPSA